MRLFKSRFYVCRQHPGISGFQQWDKWEYFIVSGSRAQGRDRLNVTGEFVPGCGHTYELDDGHLPGHRPVTAEPSVVRDHLTANPFSMAVVLAQLRFPVSTSAQVGVLADGAELAALSQIRGQDESLHSTTTGITVQGLEPHYSLRTQPAHLSGVQADSSP